MWIVIRDEQDQVVWARARDERADRVVELLVDVPHLRADLGLLVARGVAVVGRHHDRPGTSCRGMGVR